MVFQLASTTAYISTYTKSTFLNPDKKAINGNNKIVKIIPTYFFEAVKNYSFIFIFGKGFI